MMSTQDIYSESFMTNDTKASDTTEKSTGEALKERLFYRSQKHLYRHVPRDLACGR